MVITTMQLAAKNAGNIYPQNAMLVHFCLLTHKYEISKFIPIASVWSLFTTQFLESKCCKKFSKGKHKTALNHLVIYCKYYNHGFLAFHGDQNLHSQRNISLF